MLRQRRWLIAAVVAVTLIATSTWLALRPRVSEPIGPAPAVGAAPAEVVLAPERPDPAGLNPAGSLTLTSDQPLSAAAVRESLTVEPAVELTVEKADAEGKRFTVKPAQTLEWGRVYRFQLAPAAGVNRPYRWSFQTRTEFRLLGTLPRHEGTDVPVTTGIELTFTHEDYADPVPFFSIEPKVTGRFERHKQTLVFVPDQQLKEGQVYTVTLKKGLRRTQGEGELTQDHVFAFETATPNRVDDGIGFYLPENVAEYPAGDRPVFSMWYSKSAPGPIDVAVYRYPDAEGFVAALQKVEQFPWWAWASRQRQQEEESSLTRVASFAIQPQAYDNGSFLVFPDPLPQGFYLASFQLGKAKRQVRFQVTDLSYHVTATTTNTLVWLNDVATGQPVAGAAVGLPGSRESVTTGPDGVAVLPTPGPVQADENRAPLFLTARAGTKEAVIYGPVSSRYYYSSGQKEQKTELYWRYLYLDRRLYKPDDTAQVWGVVHPREPGATPVDSVRVEVIRSDYRDFDGREVPLVSTTLPVKNSTYIGSLPLPHLKPGYYELRVSLGEEQLSSDWFEVEAYSKPAYQLEVTSDKQAIFSGEPVTFRVKASFFEGTPVPDLPLDYRIDWTSNSQTITTDANGEAVVTITQPHRTEAQASYPSSLWFTVNAQLAEVGEIADERRITVFQRDIMTQTRVEQNGSEATVAVQLNQVSLDRTRQADWWSGEQKGDPIAGREVEFSITELNWSRVSDGTYYDFIEKQVRTRYRYTEAHRRMGTYKAASDPTGKALYTFPVDPEKQYRVEVRVQDSRGLWVAESTYVTGRRYADPYRYEADQWYHLVPEVPNKGQGAIGEMLGFTMKRGEVEVESRSNSFLFFTTRRGLQEYQVEGTATHRMALRESDVPRTYLRAVHFDGRNYHEASRVVEFDQSLRRLDVTVTADKAAYRPGETVKLQVQVKDRQGRPSAGAQVNLNLVDEALYALRDQQVNPLDDLYSNYVRDGVLRSRSSHDVPTPAGGAEKGGEGGGVRRDFKDAVLFTAVTTDSQGRATASFAVPDNLTMWRLTYQAVKVPAMEAGHGSTGIPVKLPFFADLVLGDSFLLGDQPVVQVRSYGEELKQGEPVQYEVTLRSPSGKEQTWREGGAAFAARSVPLGKLEEKGTYTVQVRATSGRHTDALEKPFTVLDSYLRQNRVDFQLLSPESRLKGASQGLTTLTFLDWERGRYLESLYQLRWSWSNRFESRLARSVAASLLKEQFDYEYSWPEPELAPFRYQTDDGSIAILPYSSGDLKLSALTADLAAERFDSTALTLYFQRILDEEGMGRDRKVIALYGLASLGQPVLTTAHSLLTQADLSPLERLYLALAVAELGDLEGARPVYRALMTAHAEAVAADVRLTAGRETDEQLEATALAAALAGKLGETETPALLSYLRENQPAESLIVLEALLAVQGGLSWLPDRPVAFTYTLDGKESQKQLKPGERFQVALQPEQLEQIRFTAIEGKVAVISTYEAPGRPSIEQGGSTITRTYSPAPHEWKPGDLVRVTLHYTVPANGPNGGYELTDYLPSGLRIVERSWRYGMRVDWQQYDSWPLLIDGQKVSFWAGKQGQPIQYIARVLAPGEYQAEEPVLQHQKSGLIYGLGNQTVVRIEW